MQMNAYLHSHFQIGDCYVAVTGLPVAQPNHAILMVKFARECLGGMSKYTRQLEGKLGPDTSELALRVGLHSGPVTAGVLRGEKARFQLFGDTVNTSMYDRIAQLDGRVAFEADTLPSLLQPREWNRMAYQVAYTSQKTLRTY
jgi:class 3 adenylate cyclase